MNTKRANTKPTESADDRFNLSAVLYRPNDLRMEKKPIEDPADNEVLLEMHCVGICGSDVHYLTHGQIGKYRLENPMVVGHEASGIVFKVGSKVKHLKVGDRVAIEPGVPCRECHNCKIGRYNLCHDIYFCATPPDDGNLSRFYRHAADFCHKLPDHVSLEEGALLEPLSVGVHACRRGGITLGSKVLITGAGPIGLVTLLTAKALGAFKVIITDIQQHKLETAVEMGADASLLIERDVSLEETSAKIVALLGGEEPDVTIDCSGIESTIKLGMLTTQSGGCLVIVGAGSQEVKIPLVLTMSKEIDIRGVFRYANDYPIALSMVASGKIDVMKLITHNYLLEDTLHAFETAKTGRGNAIKVMIHCKEGLELKNNSINTGHEN
uniref:Sorbitol dehydrogenase n=1 Tax=Cacopsylla melanoneura TaxID=428564 RepID=A0A8D8R9R5_9HEMI